jgi:hypothetical protein
MAGLWTRFRVFRVAATSASLVSRPYCAAITSYPSACSGPVSLFQHEPSAQIPWQNTMLGLVGVDMDSSSIVLATAPFGGTAQTPAWPDG